MRTAVLLALSAAAALGGCGITDCGPFPKPTPFEAQVSVAAAPVADTLHVVFLSTAIDEIRTPDVTPVPTAGPGVRMVWAGTERFAGAAPPEFEASAQGDTVWVRRRVPLVQRACSPPPEGLDLSLVYVEVPAGVRHVRVSMAQARDVAFPTSAAPMRRASAFFTV